MTWKLLLFFQSRSQSKITKTIPGASKKKGIPRIATTYFLPYIQTYIQFRCSPRGFSATCLQQMQGPEVEGLNQTAICDSQWFFVWDIKLCPQLTVHNTEISQL